jgi:hypothetical protein
VTELLGSTAFGVHEVIKDRVYELKKFFFYDKPEYRRDLFTVFADRENLRVECECGKFEKDGILCCHILRLFNQWDVIKIPPEYVLPRWTSAFREEELLKHKQVTLEVHGTEATQCALRYAMLMNNLNDVCSDVSRDANMSREFIEEVQKIHKRLMSGKNQQSEGLGKELALKDPPVIKKATSKNKKATSDVDSSVPETSKTQNDGGLDIWVKTDGSSTNPAVEVREKVVNGNTTKKRKQTVEEPFKDPPVFACKSVNKGNRMKPQSEKKSKRRKKTQA